MSLAELKRAQNRGTFKVIRDSSRRDRPEDTSELDKLQG